MSDILIVTENRKARHDYDIIETFEAGVALMGSEVKSIRDKQMQLKDAFVAFKGDEAYLQNSHIAEYKASSYNNHVPERHRKLLMHRHELNKIYGALREKGLSCIPLKVYFKKGRVKIEIALVKGRKLHDKREAIKRRDETREAAKSLRRSKR